MSNPIVKPVLPDGMAGYDKHGQFYVGYDMYNEGKITFVSSSNIHDVLDETCPLCNKGWEKSVVALLDQHWTRDQFAHVHRSCYERHLGFIERAVWVEALMRLAEDVQDVFGSFDKAHVAMNKMVLTMKQIPNEYRGAWNTPWYEVALEGLPGCPVAKLKFGSRKRVYNIDVSGVTTDALKLIEAQFVGQEYQGCTVTQGIHEGHFYIHAWTKEQVFSFIEKIVNVIKLKGSYIHQEITTNDAVPT